MTYENMVFESGRSTIRKPGSVYTLSMANLWVPSDALRRRWSKMYPFLKIDPAILTIEEFIQKKRIQVRSPEAFFEDMMAKMWKREIEERIKATAIDLAADILLQQKEQRIRRGDQ